MQSRMWGAGSGSRSRLNTREQSSLLNESGTTSLSQAQQGLAAIDQLQAEREAERERQRQEAAQAAWQAMYDWVTTTQDKLVQTEDVYGDGQQRTPEQIADDRAKLTAQMEALPGLQAGLDAHREYYNDDSWSTMMGYIDMVTQGNQDVQSGLAFSDTDWQGYQSLLDSMSQKDVTDIDVYNPYWFYKSQAQGQEALQKLDYTSYLESMANATNEMWMATTDLDALEDQLANEKQTLSELMLASVQKDLSVQPANYLSLYGGASTNQTDNPIRLETNTDITSPVTIALQNPLQKQVGKNQQEVADQTAVVNKLESDIQAIKDYRNNRYTEMIADVDGKISVVKGKLDDVTQKIINYQNEQADGLYIPRLDQEPPETPYDDQIDKLREEYQTLEERREGLQAGKEWNAATEEEKQAIKEYQEKFQKYFDLADQEDFEEKSRYLGPSMKDKIPLGSLGKADADTVYMYINAGEDFRKYVNSNQIMSGVPETDRLQKYAGFTNDEKAVFNYIYNTQGAEAAQNYLDDYNTDLLNRYGVEIGKHISGNSLMEALFSVDAGLNSFKNGVTGWFTDEARIDPLEIANSYVRENLDTDVGRWFYDLGNAGGNMLPTLALSAINPVAGTASVFASAGGHAYQSALRDGYSRGEAYTYGVMDGTLEAGTYYLLGKMAGGAGKLTEKAAKPFYDAVKTASQKMAVKYTFSALGNGFENYLQTVMQPVIRNLALGEDNEVHLFSSEALYNAAQGVITAGIISAAEIGANRIKNPFFGVFGTAGKVSKQVDADGNTKGYIHFADDGKTIDGYVQMAEAGETGMHKRATSYGDIAGYGYLDADGVVQLGKIDAATGEFITDSFDPRQRSNSTVATNTPMDMDTSMQLWNASLDAVDNQARTEMLGRELAGQFRQAEIQQVAPALQYMAGKYPLATAQAFMQGYDGGLPVNMYEAGFDAVYQMAQQGYSMAEVMTMPENSYSHMLMPEQVELAYEAGAAEFETEISGQGKKNVERNNLLGSDNDDMIENITGETVKLPHDGDGDRLNEGDLETRLKNIREFVDGHKTFDDVVDDYAKVYEGLVKSNKSWRWNKNVEGGKLLTEGQKRQIKQHAEEKGYIIKINVIKKPGLRYGDADFKEAGLVKKTLYLPEDKWLESDRQQFKWLDDQIGGPVEGYTWNHTLNPGEMQLVPFGYHNITSHNGGRTEGYWAFGKR